ncbi:hypothetical protein B0H63DRAFT_141557 [Podospora didyma]|uniref:Calcium channel YVC1 n=1 Tax=Podospora didyma TaxID=330526 RepID=A0AAE0U0Z6_9PEZI|nr:hypothetical protein B0H63DRAFT_141557 [Podospora didyma]
METRHEEEARSSIALADMGGDASHRSPSSSLSHDIRHQLDHDDPSKSKSKPHLNLDPDDDEDEDDNMAPLILRRRPIREHEHEPDDTCSRTSGENNGNNSGSRGVLSIPVYVSIHRVRRLMIAAIDDPYTLEQLRTPRMTTLLVRPLVDRLYDPNDLSTVYCLLANRVQFLRSQSDEALHQTVNIARAMLCELVAARVLRRFHEDHPGRSGLLILANMLVSSFDPFDTAPEAVRRQGRSTQWPTQQSGGRERKLTALELAILSESKILIASLACQRVVDAVYRGLVVYTPVSLVDILPDHYKHHPVSLYEPRRAPILNHRRLIVPRLRNLIEVMHFGVLLVLYALTMMHCNGNPDARGKLGIYEAAFTIFTAGWVLEQFAAIIEHGWEVHAQNLWSFLDITFILIYGIYVAIRAVELLLGDDINFALPVLCTAAPVLLTRIAFNLMPDNIVFIAMHAMMRDFMRLTFIAMWCFTGFLLGLVWLMRTTFDAETAAWDATAPTWATIGKWLLWIWFGLDGTGIERTAEFHVVLGPTLAVMFAFLGNTLFLTILVAILTNTFSKIMNNAAAEIEFRRAVLTFQGVKSDSIFSYPPPFNVVALVVLLPLKFIIGPAAFHHINVAAIRIINMPLLLLIALYERRRVWARGIISKSSNRTWHFGLNPYGDIQAVFSADPPQEIVDALEKMDALDDPVEQEQESVGAGRLSKDLGGWPSPVRRRKQSTGSRYGAGY